MVEEKFSCRKCKKTIGGHNQYLHEGMCDDCFFEEYFPEEAQIFETELEKIRRECRINEKDNLKFREFVKFGEFDQYEFNKIVKEIENKIDCTKCANCCKIISPILEKEDIKRIVLHLKIEEEKFIQTCTEKEGRGIKLKSKPCVFLKENKCQIYNARPNACKEFPYLKKDLKERTIQFLGNAEICPIVFNVLENAKEAYLENMYEFENFDL